MGIVSTPNFFETPQKGFYVTYTKLSTERYHTAYVWDDTDEVPIPSFVDDSTPGEVTFYFEWDPNHQYHAILNFSSPSIGASGSPTRVAFTELRGRSDGNGEHAAAPEGKAGRKGRGNASET